MSRVIQFSKFPLFILCLLVATGCATPLPPAYNMPGKGPELPGSVVAIVSTERQVAVANPDGVFLRKDGGKWDHLEITGLKDPSKVTCLAFFEGNLFVGTDGEGLYAFSDGSWEVVSRKYSGLPGDGVLSLAVDGEDDGLPGTTLWVGTREGIAALSDGKWKMYSPAEGWLDTLPGGTVKTADAEVYRGGGYKLVRSEGLEDLFAPPVTVIAVGPERVVFANQTSRLALIGSGGVAVVHFLEGRRVRSLAVDENVIWVGTDKGLLWGGVSGKTAGRPWPTNYPQISWIGSFSGSRDTRPYEYGWFQLGYNSAKVNDLFLDAGSLWIAYAKGVESRLSGNSKGSSLTGEDPTDPIIDLRRYLNINEYIKRMEKPAFESYGKDDGLKGEYQVVESGPQGKEVWVGTKKGLYKLER